MAMDDKLADFGEVSLASLTIPGVDVALSDVIYMPSGQTGPAPMWLVITCTQTIVGTGSPACRFSLSAASASDAASIVYGYDLWIYGNMDFAGIFAKGIPAANMIAGTTLFQVPVAASPLLSRAYRYLGLTVMQVVGAGAISAGKVKAYLTSSPPAGGLIFPNATV
jgi:hypothetical protein